MTATLPDALAAALEHEILATRPGELRAAAQALSTAYRARTGIPRTLSPLERAAYLAVRFPSTFAVADTVWRRFARVISNDAIKTVVDLGSGPGTASLAARKHLPDTASFTLLERDAGWRTTAERLATATGTKVTFRNAPLTTSTDPHDIVVASYALGELPEAERSALTTHLWRFARMALVIIEPGTPAGFTLVHEIRAQALELGAHAAAPCTHDAACPMTANDWCHQPVRVARGAAHRSAKQAPLPYEDEKFSYVILTRDAPRRPSTGRIVRKPIKNPGHVHLDVCAEGELKRVSVGKSARSLYRAARDAVWGGNWPAIED